MYVYLSLQDIQKCVTVVPDVLHVVQPGIVIILKFHARYPPFQSQLPTVKSQYILEIG